MLGNSKVLDKRVPSNPRYANVQSRLNTGPNMRKVLASYEGTSGPNAHKHKADEYFTRLKPSTLEKLLQSTIEEEENVYKLDDDGASMYSSVVPSQTAVVDQGNILVLDVRSFEKFDECHVYGARHYDISQLNKATNNFPKEIYYFKGSVESEKMVILYDEDGKRVVETANAFVEKGIENTYAISGGFLGIAARCPMLLEGSPPDPESLSAMLQRAGLVPSGSNGSVASTMGIGNRGINTAASTRTQSTNLSSVGGQSARLPAWK